MSSEQPPSYLIYTTGLGFPPLIQGIPQAMKGIATVFLLALLTDRAFILDWRSPSGFDRVFVPRYIDWRYNVHFKDDEEDYDSIPRHVHEIGTTNWNKAWNSSAFFEFYTETDFNDYFSRDIEVVQSHSYDFTYALLRNKHHREKVRGMGIDRVKCLLCCIWGYLFKQSPMFTRNMALVARKHLGLSHGRDLVFLDLSLPVSHLSRSLQLEYTQEALKCTEKVITVLQNPVCVMASNSYFLLEEVPNQYTRVSSNGGMFFSQERYQLELQRQINSTTEGALYRTLRGNSRKRGRSAVVVPKTEENALVNFFMGYFLQLNSTVLFTAKRSPYSENMAALRHYYRPSGTYLVYPGGKCKLEKFQE